VKKRNLLVIAPLVALMGLLIAIPATAWEAGCTPGYWKQEQHADSWVEAGIAPTALFSAEFGVGPDISLLAALSAKNKDFPDGEAAFLRHAVAAYLNQYHPDVSYSDPIWVEWQINVAYNTGDFEGQKDLFEGYNEIGCPLN
jgi:hypothetical protein